MQFLARLGLGGCLADDMGLGKTATTLAHLVERPGPHLVVCPLSVVHNWEAESRPVHARRCGSWSTTAPSVKQGGPALFGLDDADLVVTTYGLLARDLDSLTPVEWTTLVLDEAQMIKNPTTKAAKAVRQLRAGQKLALTGTPVENRLSELWAILDAVNPGLLGSQQRFREQLRDPDRALRRPDVAAERLRRAHPTVRAAAHQGRPTVAARPARQDRADRLRPAHPRAGRALPAGRRPVAPRRRAPRKACSGEVACWPP